MIEHPTVLVIGASPKCEEVVRAALRDAVLLRLERPSASSLATACSGGPRVALVDLGSDGSGVGLHAIEELARGASASSVPVVALAARKDPELILQAMRAGAREFVVLTEPGELARVVGELWRRVAADEPSGQIVAMFPAKGGLGATTLATNLAGALQEGGRKVVVVDLDVQLGDVLVFLDSASRYTIADVLQNVKRLDHELLHSSLCRHASGIYVLSQSDHLEDADKVEPSQIAPLLTFLARHFDYVVCDGLRGFDEIALATLDAAHHVLLMVTQDVPAVKNAQRCLDVMRRLGYGDDKVHLVVNRHQKSDIDLQSIADNLGVPVQASVANDFSTVSKAINRGMLIRELAPRARLVEDILRLARLYGVAPAKERRGFLRGLFARGDDKSVIVDEAGERSDEPERAPEAV
jgi:pilus assembly protein CpaE